MSSVLRLSALTLLAACTGAARTSSLAHPTEKPAMGVSKACEDARRDRALAPALRADGRWIKAAELGLAVRATCPANQAEDEAVVEELLALGALDEARAVATAWPASPRMKAALDIVARLLQPPTPTEVAEANDHVDRAELAEAKGESEKAREAWLLAVRLVRPNARALAGAARASAALGQEVEARKLGDRTLVDLARQTGGAPRLEVDGAPRAKVSFVGWSANGARLAYAAGRELRVLDGPTFASASILTTDEPITQAAWAKDGRSLFVATDQHLRELDARTGELRRELPGRSQVSLSADGKVLAFLASDGVAVADAASGVRKWTLPAPKVKRPRIALAPTGKLLALNGELGCQVYDLGNGKVTFTTTWTADELAFSRDSFRIALSSGIFVSLWSLGLGTDPTKLHYSKRDVHGLAFAPDSQSVGIAGTLTTYVIAAREKAPPPLALHGHTDGTTAVAFDPTGRWVASGAADGAVRVFPLGHDAPTVVLRPKADPVTAATFGEGALYTGHATGPIRRWDLKSAGIQPLLGHLGAVSSLAIRADGGRLLSGSLEGQVRVWDGPSWAPHTILHWPGNIFGRALAINEVRFGPGDDQVFVGHEDEVARLWSQSAWKTIKATGQLSLLAVSANGRVALQRSKGKLQVTDLGKVLSAAGNTGGPAPTVKGVELEGAKGGAGFALATTGSHAAILGATDLGLWDAATGKRLATVARAPYDASRVAFDGLEPPTRIAWTDAEGVRVALLSELGAAKLVATPSPPTLVALDARGERLVVGLADGRFAVVDVAAGTIRFFAMGNDRGGTLVSSATPVAAPFGAGIPVEAFPDLADDLVCRGGNLLFPASLCRERWSAKGLLAKGLL
ncbi:MAG: hypothetical protein JNL79_00690 [Myxococcales bacterium]|nr:hypothetical protein [Myxococcales bacterium]